MLILKTLCDKIFDFSVFFFSVFSSDTLIFTTLMFYPNHRHFMF